MSLLYKLSWHTAFLDKKCIITLNDMHKNYSKVLHLKFNNKKVILFDLDGTLIDSAPDLALAVNHMLNALNRDTFSQDIIRYWVGNGAQVLVKRALSGQSEIDENLDPVLFEKALDIFLSFYAQNLAVTTITYPNVPSTLKSLKSMGYRLAIVTNKPFAFVEPILEGLKLTGLFELILGGDSLDQKKPDPAPLLHVCEQLNVTVEQCVMVGDSKNDILAANTCGMQSIGVTYGYNYGEDIGVFDPDVVINNFGDLLKFLSKEKAKIAIVGGGVAGASTALYLGQLGLNVTLFEKQPSLVSGPPFCHLHAGGNLYREISDEQCVKLLKQSIDFLHFYPFVVDYRPTVIVLPTSDSGTPDALLPRLKLLRGEYEALIKADPNNKVLGESANYYKLYSKEQIEGLKQQPVVSKPKTCDEWMIPVAKNIDLDKVQFPLIMVQEYGLNLFRLAAGASLALEQLDNVSLRTKTIVSNIQESCNANGWNITYINSDETHQESFDYLINAAGFRTGKIDDLLGAPCKAMVEFKAAYVSKWEESNNTLFPEIIFHGERGTPQGMGQFTPYPGGYFQLHGMTKDITLYEDGLVANTPLSCQPQLGQNFIEKIERSWTKEETAQRTNSAIKHLSQFIPAFSNASVGSKPLFGAQQIPGDDPTLRVAEVSFPAKRYARCEIVKVSSVMDMIDAIMKQLIELDYIDRSLQGKRDFSHITSLEEDDIKSYAEVLCKEREYPTDLAHRNVSNT